MSKFLAPSADEGRGNDAIQRSERREIVGTAREPCQKFPRPRLPPPQFCPISSIVQMKSLGRWRSRYHFENLVKKFNGSSLRWKATLTLNMANPKNVKQTISISYSVSETLPVSHKQRWILFKQKRRQLILDFRAGYRRAFVSMPTINASEYVRERDEVLDNKSNKTIIDMKPLIALD